MTQKEKLTRLLAEAVLYKGYRPKPGEYRVLSNSKYAHVLDSINNKPVYLTEQVFETPFDPQTKQVKHSIFINAYDKRFLKALTREIESHFNLGVDSLSGWSNIDLTDVKRFVRNYLDTCEDTTSCKDTERFVEKLLAEVNDLPTFIWKLYWFAK